MNEIITQTLSQNELVDILVIGGLWSAIIVGCFLPLLCWVGRWVIHWTEDHEDEQGELLSTILYMKLRGFSASNEPYRRFYRKRDNYHCNLAEDDAFGMHACFALGWTLLPSVIYVSVIFYPIAIMGGLLYIIAHVTRLAKRQRKILTKHMETKDAHANN